jgi:predicted O-linked N-acetylglucosamine transferase (SPINDLY family)
LTLLGNRAGAIDSFRRAIVLAPDHAIAHNNLGMVLAEDHRLDEALAAYQRACELNPRFAESHSNQGNLLQRLGRFQEALASFERALKLDPENAITLSNCGNALLKLNFPDQALSYFEQSLRLQSELVPALNNRGNALRALRRFAEALSSYDRALVLQPDFIEALSNRAGVLLELERFEDAVESCNRLLEMRPDFAPSLMYRGFASTFLEQPRYADAVRDFARLHAVAPDTPYGLGGLLHSSAMIYDWSHSEHVSEAVSSALDGKCLISPFALLAFSDSARTQLECARACAAASHPAAKQPLWCGERSSNKKIRVAYLSGDLRNHALSFLMVGVFEKHDRDRFEIYGVSYRAPENDPFGARVLSALDIFWDVREQTDLQVAQIMREMRIDIAVDLVGFTRGQRFSIFSHRPAPVQVSYLGCPVTTGAPYMDYILADDFVIPPDSRCNYSENVVYLPDCFQANDDRRLIAAPGPDRVECGLPEQGLVFCSFNNSYKIAPPVFSIWCRLLQACPGSVLWLLGESEVARQNLLREAGARGINPARFVFARRLPYEQHLARMQLADLFLDTFPFNAGTTASDALWAGLPVLTCSGEAFASRMAGSLLRAVGLTELITHDLDDYERLALQLAYSPGLLKDLRARLASNRLTQPLFDTARFCRHLETAYQTMHDRAQRSERPSSFAVLAR